MLIASKIIDLNQERNNHNLLNCMCTSFINDGKEAKTVKSKNISTINYGNELNTKQKICYSRKITHNLTLIMTWLIIRSHRFTGYTSVCDSRSFTKLVVFSKDEDDVPYNFLCKGEALKHVGLLYTVTNNQLKANISS